MSRKAFVDPGPREVAKWITQGIQTEGGKSVKKVCLPSDYNKKDWD